MVFVSTSMFSHDNVGMDSQMSRGATSRRSTCPEFTMPDFFHSKKFCFIVKISLKIILNLTYVYGLCSMVSSTI